MSSNPSGSTPATATDNQDLVVLLAGHDTDELREYVAPLLDRPAVTVETVDDDATAIDRLEDRTIDCLVANYDPKSAEGMAILDYLRETEADIPVILLPSTRTTVIDSRNFVVDVESVVDPDEPIAAGDLADPVVSTVEQQRAAVAARRRHQLQSASRAIARDAGDATDEDAVARSLADRLGDTDAVDAAWVAALEDDGVDVHAAAGDTPMETGVAGAASSDDPAGAGGPPGTGGHQSDNGRMAPSGGPRGSHGSGDKSAGTGGDDNAGGGHAGGSTAGNGTARASAGDGSAPGATGSGTTGSGATGDGPASNEAANGTSPSGATSGSTGHSTGDADGPHPSPGSPDVDDAGGGPGVGESGAGPGIDDGGGSPSIDNGGDGPGVDGGGGGPGIDGTGSGAGDAAAPGERVREAVEEAVDGDGPAMVAGEDADLAAVPVETPGGERWGVTVASDSRYAFAEPEVRALEALGDTVERALSAVASAPTRLPTDTGAHQQADIDPGALAELVEHLEVPVAVYDEGGLVHAASPAFGGLLDRDHEALSGEPIWEVLPEPRMAAFDEHWAAFEEGDARITTLTLAGQSHQIVTTRLVLDDRPYNVVLPVDPEADADTWLAEVLAYELRHWMTVAETEGVDEDTLESFADRVESSLDAEVDASGSVSDLNVTAQPLGGVASDAWSHVLDDAGNSAVQGGRTVLADRTVLFRLFTHLFRTLLTYGEASAVSVGVAEDGFFVRDDGSGVPHEERAYAEAASMTDAESGASIRVARRLAQRQGWQLDIAANDDGGTRFDVRGVQSPYRDVDDADLRETQLGVFNRVLRHNIRNTVNVVRGNAELLADRLEGSEAELFDHLHAATEEIVAVGDRAREFERIEARTESGPQRIDLATTITQAVDSITEQFPDADVTSGVDNGVVLETYPETLRIVLGNLVRNAVEHNDRATPTVTITARKTNGTVGVAVRDDGPGIPDEELEVLSAGAETALEHGSGLGLWIAKWGVQQLGGDLTFQANDPRGTTAVVTLPRTAPDPDADLAESQTAELSD